MNSKPSYEALENRIAELERRLAKVSAGDPTDGGMAHEGPIHSNEDTSHGTPSDTIRPDATLSDIIDTKVIQFLMDRFYALTGIGVAIIDLSGNLLVATGWRDICVRFHRVHPETLKNCRESDLTLADGVAPGTFRLYKCKNNMWDIATPIMAGDKKYGNLYLGQFLFDDETVDAEAFRRQAAAYGFDTEAYMAALDRVPRFSRQTINTVMEFYTTLAGVISEMGHANILLNSIIREKNALVTSLSQSEARYRDLVEDMNDALYAVGADGIIQYVSRSIQGILGYCPEEMIGRNFAEFIHPDDIGEIRKAFGDVLNNIYYPNEYRILAKDGGFRWVRTSSRAAGKDGDTAGIRGVMVDITGKKLAESRLRESNERFQKVFESQPDAILVLDADSPPLILDANPAATEIFGYRREELIGQPSRKLHVDASRVEVFRRELAAALRRKGLMNHFEFSMKRKGGDVFPSEHTALELKNTSGERTGWLSIIRDLTERKAMRRRLEHAQKMEAIGTLAGGIAHDFNNILFPLMGYAEMLEEEIPEDSALLPHVSGILRATLRARDLVKQILTFSRQDESPARPLMLQPVVKEALNLLRATIPTIIDFAIEIDPACGAVTADPTQIHQIVMNLATNAFHAMEAEGGSLSVTLRQVSVADEPHIDKNLPSGDYALLTVADTGPGIPPEILDKIFDPYFTTKDKHKGTGLGLSVVRGIVETGGGSIRILSEPGAGTRALVYLPIIDTPDATPEKLESDLPTGGGERILLVDDEQVIVDMTREMLQRLGYRVTPYSDSLKALEAFSAGPDAFDLVLTDMTMPHMTGVTLAEKIRKIRHDIPIILCTGFSGRIDDAKCARMGIQGYILKPVVKRDMAKMIRKALGSSR